MELQDILQQIKNRPAMYLGSRSISCLYAFLNGYIGTRHNSGLSPTKQEEQLNDFQEWITNKYRITTAHSWAKIILFYSGDEREALDKFFELWETFTSQELTEAKLLKTS